MLTELHIQNFALVDELRLEIGSGFCALTGETGAGKSIIVDAIGAALGERTGTEVIRSGTEKAIVEAVFDVSDSPAASNNASDLGFDAEDGLLILSREITRNGRSQCRINGRPATASMLREITSQLIDIHGQHEHQSLLSIPIHIEIFDTWCGDKVLTLREEARALHQDLAELLRERNRLHTNERERARLIDLYNFQLEEIKAANLILGEEEELSQERNRLANAEKLFTAAAEIHDALADEDGGAVDSLGNASMSAEKIVLMDPSMSGFLEVLNSALFNAQEALASIRDYRDEVEANPERLEQIEERLDVLKTLKKKYGDSIEDVLNYGNGLSVKLDELTNSEERSLELDSRIDDLTSQLTEVSKKLTKCRKEASSSFEKAIEAELTELAMGKTTFKVSIEPTEPGPNGADLLEFLISPNPGEPVKPLAKIASGGEMSRIMLALKTVTAGSDVPTLVFDEVDTGIGGRTAQVLGEKLASLGEKCQVMCVTHLPQVASKAIKHMTVCKVVEGGRSFVRIEALDGEERVAELARMLGGEEGSTAAAQHAREMLSFANNGNCKIR